MEDGILPYVIFLVVPVLGRMSDSDNDVRLLANPLLISGKTFSTSIVMPLTVMTLQIVAKHLAAA
jgi:hypothetical protein